MKNAITEALRVLKSCENPKVVYTNDELILAQRCILILQNKASIAFNLLSKEVEQKPTNDGIFPIHGSSGNRIFTNVQGYRAGDLIGQAVKIFNTSSSDVWERTVVMNDPESGVLMLSTGIPDVEFEDEWYISIRKEVNHERK